MNRIPKKEVKYIWKKLIYIKIKIELIIINTIIVLRFKTKTCSFMRLQ